MYEALIPQVIQQIGIDIVSHDETRRTMLFALIERIMDEGCVVVIKFDGARTQPDDTGPYTAIITGQPLGDTFFRTDAKTFEAAVAYVIVEYAKHRWQFEVGNAF